MINIKNLKGNKKLKKIANVLKNSTKVKIEYVNNILGEDSILGAHFLNENKIQEEIINRLGRKSSSKTRNGIIVIATQVVEQSIDIDFDYMISDLAPVNLIIQRPGRIMRHTRKLNGDIGQKEERGQVRMGIHSPGLEENIDEGVLSLSSKTESSPKMKVSLEAIPKLEAIILKDVNNKLELSDQ